MMDGVGVPLVKRNFETSKSSIQECENKLSQYSSSTVNDDAYVEYLENNQRQDN
ncbi:hypothetical protein INT48_003829 [Thamnidium elegans]|uniref:Uncharacterized protein n=1 Tax=Thamnidium elegans TaxID=101142 RepID=A0A8H7VWV7_9FUNG|nr:hypothetical protein INT48_003829 [Thamnidium elegans]